MLKQIKDMTEKEKQMVIDMGGKIVLYLAERRSLYYMADKLKLEPWQVDHNIDQLLYELRKSLGWKRYIRALFIK